MTMVEHAHLDAVMLLVINAIGLATDVIIDTRSGHEITFIGRINEHLPGKGLPAQCGDRRDLVTVLRHALGAVEPLVTHHFDTELLDVIFEDLLRCMRFEDPHGAVLPIHRRSALALVAILRLLLLHPRLGLLIVHVDAMVEVACQTTDHRLVARIRESKTTAAEAAEMLVRRDNDDGLAHLLHLHCRGDCRTSAAVNHHIMIDGAHRREGNQQTEAKDESHGARFVDDVGAHCNVCPAHKISPPRGVVC